MGGDALWLAVRGRSQEARPCPGCCLLTCSEAAPLSRAAKPAQIGRLSSHPRSVQKSSFKRCHVNNDLIVLNDPSANICSCKSSWMMSSQLQTFLLRDKALQDLSPPHEGFTLAGVKVSRAETSRCKNHSPLKLNTSRWDNKRYPVCGSVWRITDAHPHRVILSPSVAHVNCEFFICVCMCAKGNLQISWTDNWTPFFFFFLSLSKANQWRPFRGRCVKVFGDTKPHAKLVYIGSRTADMQGVNKKPLNRTSEVSLHFRMK